MHFKTVLICKGISSFFQLHEYCENWCVFFYFIGVKWKKNRKLIQPYFHVNVLRKYINIFYESALKAVEELKPNETLNITNLVNEYILEVLQCTYMQFIYYL